jgi:hypothetical protein
LIPFSQSEQASERAWGKIYKKKEWYILTWLQGGCWCYEAMGLLAFLFYLYLRSPDSTVPLPSANSCSLQLHQMMFALGFFFPCSRNPGWSLLCSWCLVWSLVSWAVSKA